MFAIAFSIISITTGIFLKHGFGLTNWGPASIWTGPVVAVGKLMVAFVVAEPGTRIRWPATPTWRLSRAPGHEAATEIR